MLGEKMCTITSLEKHKSGQGGGGIPNSLCSFLLKPYLYQCGIDMVFGRFWLFLKELELRNTYLTHINVKGIPVLVFWVKFPKNHIYTELV